MLVSQCRGNVVQLCYVMPKEEGKDEAEVDVRGERMIST